jgi:TRAP-type C4-dicarboxylate transport system substrate-binding protein
MSVSQIADYKLWEIAQSFTDTYMGRTLFAIIVNKESWNALPKDVQQVMDNMSTSLVKKGAEIMHAETDLGEKLFRENGGTIYQLTPEQEKAWYDYTTVRYQFVRAGWNRRCIGGNDVSWGLSVRNR